MRLKYADSDAVEDSPSTSNVKACYSSGYIVVYIIVYIFLLIFSLDNCTQGFEQLKFEAENISTFTESHPVIKEEGVNPEPGNLHDSV